MIGFIKTVLGLRHPTPDMKQARDPKRYAREKKQAISGDRSRRMALAINPRTHQEILYYMAEHDADPEVRHAVARNKSTPVQASPLLARDENTDVRLALAERLVRLLPSLSKNDYSELYALSVQILSGLALDEVLKIRVALSSALKDCAYAPPAVVSQLARDIERDVAEPILRFCVALPDDVMIDILKNAPQGWAIQAIAGRKNVSDDVSVAVIDTGDAAGGTTLIANPGAQISRALLQEIVSKARQYPEWQEPLALRKGLPPDFAMMLAEFSSDAVRHVLIKQAKFDRRTTDEVSKAFHRRMAYANASSAATEKTGETPFDRAVRLTRDGKLNEAIVSDAMAMKEDDFVMAAIACMAQVGVADVKRVFGLQAAKPAVALCWKAGLSMRMALQIQQTMARVPLRDLIYPRDGTDYPLTETELLWQLDFLGLKAA